MCRAIGRAGAGTNNIPVKKMSERGVPVFNAPGANANAVKELVIAGMLIGARNLIPAISVSPRQLKGTDEEHAQGRRRAGKKNFAGIELPGRTLGMIGLGAIGSLVADAAITAGHECHRLRSGNHGRRGLAAALAACKQGRFGGRAGQGTPISSPCMCR